VGVLVTIDAEFVDAVRAYADDAEAVKGRNKQRDSAVVPGRVEPANPAVRPWAAARNFFMRVTHVNNTPKHDPTSPALDDELCAHFEHVEAALSARLGNFFESFRALDDILAEANATTEGTDV
jgi:hypothetical protein